MKTILYTNGDSVVWGAELENKQTERFSNLISVENNWIDCNNASAGVSNDYIYRQTMRDVSHWLETGKCWSEETGWISSDDIFVIIGWTSPTRFEWWDGEQYQQERLWVEYDKWGSIDTDKETNLDFIIHQTEIIPSYIRTFNQIIALSSFLDLYGIPYYFSNIFYEYQFPEESNKKIDKWGREQDQLGLEYLWNHLPDSFKKETLYKYIERMGGGFLPRKHPNSESHKIISKYFITKINGVK